jgi:hypothetical protein
MNFSNLRQFKYDAKFKMGFDNKMIFTGHFINDDGGNVLGKNLFIPQTEHHPAITLKITGQTLPDLNDVHSLMVRFNSAEEEEIMAAYDFTNDIFYIDK